MIKNLIQDCEAKVKQRIDWVMSLKVGELASFDVSLNHEYGVLNRIVILSEEKDPLVDCPTTISLEEGKWETASWGYPKSKSGDSRNPPSCYKIYGNYNFSGWSAYPLRSRRIEEGANPHPYSFKVTTPYDVSNIRFYDEHDQIHNFWDYYEILTEGNKKILLRDWLPYVKDEK